jgi:hypothetical protein
VVQGVNGIRSDASRVDRVVKLGIKSRNFVLEDPLGVAGVAVK